VSSDKDKSSVFKVNSVNVKVDTLKFSIRDSKHDLLYKTLKPLATGLVKRQIQKAIAGAITIGMEYVDGQLVAVRDRMADAKDTEGASRMQALQDVNHGGIFVQFLPVTDGLYYSFSNASSRSHTQFGRASGVLNSRLSRISATLYSRRLGTPQDGLTEQQRRRMLPRKAKTGGLTREHSVSQLLC
jgi:hypothetical protein